MQKITARPRKNPAVTALLNITLGAVGNYENGVSTHKADILFKVFDALKCDANYLFQDEINKITTRENAVPYEMENLLKIPCP